MHDDMGKRTPTCGVLEEMDHNLLSEASEILDNLTGAAVALLYRIGGLESCARGLCCAKGRTLAARMGCSERTVRRRVAELRDAGLVVKYRRRRRFADRGLTALGRAVLSVLRAGGQLAACAALAARVAAHLGDAEPSEKTNPEPSCSASRSAIPRKRSRVDPLEYQRPRIAGVLSDPTWSALCSWMGSAASITWARCKVVHLVFRGLVHRLGLSREFLSFKRGFLARGVGMDAEMLVRLAVEDAVRLHKSFGTVESAVGYVRVVLLACVAERRLPGLGRVSA